MAKDSMKSPVARIASQKMNVFAIRVETGLKPA
jgi:hypothetical protein